MNYKLLILFIVVFFIASCNKGGDQTSSDDLKKKELGLEEKELQLKEKDMMDKKEAELKEREKKLEQRSTEKKINLAGSYYGTIKDGTSWHVYISAFDGFNISGYNKVYWKSTPEGYKTVFRGTYDNLTGEIIMLEDKNTKGSGKFTGTVSADGKKMSGEWHRYSDNGGFTWELEKSNEEDQ